MQNNPENPEMIALKKYLSDLNTLAKQAAPNMKNAETIVKTVGSSKQGHPISDQPSNS